MTTQERIEMLEKRLTTLRTEQAHLSSTLTNLSDEMDRLLSLVKDDRATSSYAHIMEVSRQYARLKHHYLNIEDDYECCTITIENTEDMLQQARGVTR